MRPAKFTQDDVAAYEKIWPIGTKERVWLDVLLYTGLRRGDAVRFGKQHVRDGVGTIKTEKSGFTVMVTLPILPVLQRTLDAGPIGDLTFIAGERGRPLVKEAFGTMFREAARAGWMVKYPGYLRNNHYRSERLERRLYNRGKRTINTAA